MIVKRLVVGALSANCYIVGSETSGSGMIIDPGGNAADILNAVRSARLIIETIVLTHGHSDHIAALYDIQKKTGAGVAIHHEDVQLLHGHGDTSMMFGISYRTPDLPDRLLDDGDIIQAGEMDFTVVHTPGHTPGGICLLGSEEVFTGDTLFYHSIGTTMMPGSSRSQLVDSIRRRLMVLPDETTVYPGHGRYTTIGAERKSNRYLNGNGRRWDY